LSKNLLDSSQEDLSQKTSTLQPALLKIFGISAVESKKLAIETRRTLGIFFYFL